MCSRTALLTRCFAIGYHTYFFQLIYPTFLFRLIFFFLCRKDCFLLLANIRITIGYCQKRKLKIPTSCRSTKDPASLDVSSTVVLPNLEFQLNPFVVQSRGSSSISSNYALHHSLTNTSLNSGIIVALAQVTTSTSRTNGQGRGRGVNFYEASVIRELKRNF